MQYVLITGASSGIGKSLKDIFLQNNYHVIALDIKGIDPQDNLDSFICDITNKESLQNVKNTLDKQNIKLDYIINVAGIHMMASLVESPLEQMQRLINIKKILILFFIIALIESNVLPHIIPFTLDIALKLDL